jgi:hypothetical protein
MSDVTAEICKEAERLEEDVLYAEKQHFSMATIWRRLHLWLGIPSALLAALAGVSALNSHPGVAACLAVGSVILTSLMTFLQPERAATQHHQAGILYSDLRGKFRRLRLIDASDGADAADLKKKLESYAASKTEVMKASPHIGGLAYRIAKKSIRRAEHEYAADTH